jgi:hypothetical protein
VCLVIQLHPHHYPDGPTWVKLIGILLSNLTLAWFAPLLGQQSSLLNNYEAFFEIFIVTFGDSDRECTSTSKLQYLHQGS